MRKWEIYLVLFLVCLFTMALNSVHGVDRNLILNAPYTYYPAPLYPYTTDAGDMTDLTDGKSLSSIVQMWKQKSTVGWISQVNVPVVILFDLKEEATLTELTFNTVGGGGAGIMDPSISVYGSRDNKYYVPLGKLNAPPMPDPTTIYLAKRKVDLKGAKARYVAVVAVPPFPTYFVFVDEIEIFGTMPAIASSILPIQPGISASSAKDLQEILKGGRLARDLAVNFTESTERVASNWPEKLAAQSLKDKNKFIADARGMKNMEEFDKLRLDYTEKHRKLAKQAYNTDTLVWETVPDEKFVMISLPESLEPAQKAFVDTVINALEATALGVANLTESTQALTVSVSGGGKGAPEVTPRVARFSRTKGAKYIADALLATDCPQSIPSGESKLVWLGVESSGAKPGTYKYEVAINIGDSIYKIPLQVVVHNVTLSKETPLATYNWAYLDSGYGNAEYTKVRDIMLNYRINTGMNTGICAPLRDINDKIIRPVEIDEIKMTQYVEFNKKFKDISFFYPFHQRYNPPTKTFFGDSAWMSDEYKAIVKEWVKKMASSLKANGRNYNDFYFQMFDETTDPKAAQLCKLVHEADPKVRTMLTIHSGSNPQGLVDAGMDMITYHAPSLGDTPSPSFETVLSGGKELWLYNAGGKERNGRERDSLDVFRLLHWLAFRHDATGVGFWNMLQTKNNCWAEDELYFPLVYTIPPLKGETPSDIKTAETIIPSRRLAYNRMGIEDYMLLRMARAKIAKLSGDEKKAYSKKLNDIVKATILTLPGQSSYKKRNDFCIKRVELIKMIESRSKNMKSKVLDIRKQITAVSGSWETVLDQLEVKNVNKRDIYRSVMEPGYVSWAILWKELNGDIKLSFTEAIGDHADWPPSYDFTRDGIKTLLKTLVSHDGGESWADTGWTDNTAPNLRGNSDHHIRYVLALQDGTLLRHNPHGVDGKTSKGHRIVYDESKAMADFPFTAEICEMPIKFTSIQASDNGGASWREIYFNDEIPPLWISGMHQLRNGDIVAIGAIYSDKMEAKFALTESKDGGNHFSAPQIILEEKDLFCSEAFTEENDFVELDDGRLLVLMRAGGAGNNNIQLYLKKDNSGKWCLDGAPVTHPQFIKSGFPYLYRMEDGTILYYAHRAFTYSVDDGKSWHDINGLGFAYYGQLLETEPGHIVAVTQKNIGDSRFPWMHDTAMTQTSFDLERIGVVEQTDSTIPLAIGVIGEHNYQDFHIYAEIQVDGECGLAFNIDGENYDFALVVIPCNEFRAPGQASGSPQGARLMIGSYNSGKITGMRSVGIGKVMPGSWIEMQIDRADSLIKVAVKAREGGWGSGQVPASYISMRCDKNINGKIGFFTNLSTGAFKNLRIEQESTDIRSNWKNPGEDARSIVLDMGKD